MNLEIPGGNGGGGTKTYVTSAVLSLDLHVEGNGGGGAKTRVNSTKAASGGIAFIFCLSAPPSNIKPLFPVRKLTGGTEQTPFPQVL